MTGTMGKVKLYVIWPIRLEIKYPKHVRYFPIFWLTYLYTSMFVCVCLCIRARVCVYVVEVCLYKHACFECISFSLCA